MLSKGNFPSEHSRLQPNALAEAILLYAEIQQMHRNAGWRSGFAANHVLFETAGAQNYSDLSSNPPQDMTSWRGALYRQLRNALSTGEDGGAEATYAGHGRGAPE